MPQIYIKNILNIVLLGRGNTMSEDINIISVSGGKDSTALLLLAIEQGAENIKPVFADTGNEQQQTYDYIDYLETALNIKITRVKADFSAQINKKRESVANKWRSEGVSESAIDQALAILTPTKIPFLDLCIWKGRFPSKCAQFCTSELKRDPITQQVQQPLLASGCDVISWQGVRAQESKRRALLPMREYKLTHDSGAELWNYRPILNWSIDDVFAMHYHHGIKPNPLYSQGMGRVGCMPCINCRKDELLEIAKRFPEEIERIREWERLVSMASKLSSSTFFTSDYRGHGIDQLVSWSRTGRGGKQLDLFRANDDVQLCSSIYGLCE